MIKLNPASLRFKLVTFCFDLQIHFAYSFINDVEDNEWIMSTVNEKKIFAVFCFQYTNFSLNILLESLHGSIELCVSDIVFGGC